MDGANAKTSATLKQNSKAERYTKAFKRRSKAYEKQFEVKNKAKKGRKRKQRASSKAVVSKR